MCALLVRSDLGHRAPRQDAGQSAVDQPESGAGIGVLDLAQQPIVALFISATLQPDQQPFALHPLAIEAEVEVAFVQVFSALACDGRPRAAIPQHYRAPAVFALGNRALELGVVHGVVFGLDRKAFVCGVEAGAARDRPAFQHSVDLDTKIPVQPGGVMLLDDEQVAVLARLATAGRLGGALEIALGVVARERIGLDHGSGPLARWSAALGRGLVFVVVLG